MEGFLIGMFNLPWTAARPWSRSACGPTTAWKSHRSSRTRGPANCVQINVLCSPTNFYIDDCSSKIHHVVREVPWRGAPSRPLHPAFHAGHWVVGWNKLFPTSDFRVKKSGRFCCCLGPPRSCASPCSAFCCGPPLGPRQSGSGGWGCIKEGSNGNNLGSHFFGLPILTCEMWISAPWNPAKEGGNVETGAGKWIIPWLYTTHRVNADSWQEPPLLVHERVDGESQLAKVEVVHVQEEALDRGLIPQNINYFHGLL